MALDCHCHGHARLRGVALERRALNGRNSSIRQQEHRQGGSLQVRAESHHHSNPSGRVVVTGQGVVSSLGQDSETFYRNLLKGVSGVTHIDRFDTSEFTTKFAGEVKDLNIESYVSKKNARRLDDVIKYILVSGKQALDDAKIQWREKEGHGLDLARCGILVGTAMGGMQTFATACEDLHFKGFKKMNPFCIPFAINNMGGALLAMDIGFMGPNYSISTACATGNYCILSAAEHIRRGEADVMLAGGADAAVIPSGLGGFIACKALSKRNEDPASASRPWDRQRDGFVMGEGAGVLVLESLEHAQQRGATILAEFVGGAYSCDAHHMTEPTPSGEGVALCLQRALDKTGVEVDAVNYINAHATSTPAGDLAEYRAIKKSFPGKHVRMNATKSMTGHLLGGAGAIEAIVCVEAIKTGEVHPSINLNDPEDEVDMDVIVGKQSQKLDVNIALSNSFGFGGHNSSIMFKAYKP